MLITAFASQFRLMPDWNIVPTMQHAAIAQQGHKYQLGKKPVLAMQTGLVVEVREIDANEAYPLGSPITVKASWLTPLPMKYFHGEAPK